MSDFRKLSDSISASPQITVDDVADAANQGFTMVINNRPDGEDLGQPDGNTIAAAAKAHGLEYLAIPIDHSGFSEPQIDAMSDALASADGGKVLAYCRSGTRSTFLWALARAQAGDDPEAIAAAARAGGYDVSPMRPALESLSSAARK